MGGSLLFSLSLSLFVDMAEAIPDFLPVESPPAPQVPSGGPVDDPCSHDQDQAKSLQHKSSMVATMSPYVPPKSVRQRTLLNKKGNKKDVNQVEVLPGIFECNSYEKYLSFSLENDQKMENMDIFEVHREIVNCIGREPKISPRGDSTLLIEAATPEESAKLQKLKSISGNGAKCVPHKTMNQCKGTIYSTELLLYSEEKLRKEFENQKVVEVKRMMKKENGNLCPTPLLIITFNLLKLPNVLHAAWFRLRVRPYIPSPRRCYYCQMFGHVNTTCRRKLRNETEICVNCGHEQHGECDRTPYCINCKGGHSAASKLCERFKYEKEVLTLKTKEGISFKEAKERLTHLYKPEIFSYAGALKQYNNKEKIKPPNVAARIHPSEEMDVSLGNKRSLSQDSLDGLPSKIKNVRPQPNDFRLVEGPRAGPSSSCGEPVAGPSSSGGGQVPGPSPVGAGPMLGPSHVGGGPVSGPSPVSGGLVPGPSLSDGGPVLGPSLSDGGPAPGPSPVEGQLAGPSFFAGGPASGPSAGVDEILKDVIATPEGIVGVPSSDAPLLDPVVSSPSLPRVTISSKVKPTLAFSKALVSACGAKQTEILSQKSSTTKLNTSKSSPTGVKPKVPVVYDKSPQQSSNDVKVNSVGRGSIRGPSKKNR